MMWAIRRSLFVVLTLIPFAATAQTPSPTPTAQTPSATPTTASQDLLKPEQLDALVAPIALYPDTLLSSALMASTYPLEVVQADRWVNENKNLKDDQLKNAVEKQGWDDSVKSLVATPSVLSMMSTKLDWTQKLGDAVLAQQPDVMDAIQRLRSKAQANNKLQSNKQQTVTVKQEGGRQVVAIAQTDPNTVYVPYYDPAVAYGDWPYSDYPPDYFGWPGYIGAGAIAAGLAFGTGYLVGRWAGWWGNGVNWGNRNLVVNPLNANRINNINIGNNWQHNPAHRHGVKYANAQVAQRFGNNARGNAQNRMDFRGRDGQPVLKPGSDRDARPGGDRAGDRQAQRGDRAGDRQAQQRGGDRGGDRQAKQRDGGDRGAANRGGAANKRQAANQPAAGGAANKRQAANRPAAGGGARSDSAFNARSGQAARMQSARGQASLGGMGGAGFASGGGGGFRGGGGGGGFRGGGGGGRRSDIAFKHDVMLLGRLDNGLGFYRFSYNGSDKAYVGVIAQEVRGVIPEAVMRGRDGYLRVFYDKLGLTFETYDAWIAGGARVPAGVRSH